MRTFFLGICKRAMAYVVVTGMLLSVTSLSLCWQRTGSEYANVKGMTEDQRQKLQLLLNTIGTRAIREDARAPRPDALSFPGSEPSSIVSPFDNATLKLIQECLCIVKNCVKQIKKDIMVEPSEEWASLIDKIACSMIDNPDLPMNLPEGQELLAEGLTEILCRIGCPLDPDNIFEFLNLILMKVCTVDSKVDVIDSEVGTIFSKICTIDSKIDVIDDEVGTIFSKICTIDSKIDVIDDEIGTVLGKVCTIDSKIDVIDDEVGTVLSKICTIDSKIDVIDDEVGTMLGKVCTIDSKIDAIDTEIGTVLSKICTIDSKIDVIDDEVGTVIDKVCTIDSKIDVIDDEVDIVFSKICTIDSKIDVIDNDVEFAVSKLCIIDSKIDELFIDFQETWTVIGANADPVPTPNAILDVNTTTTYTVLQWLKAIYHKVK